MICNEDLTVVEEIYLQVKCARALTYRAMAVTLVTIEVRI